MSLIFRCSSSVLLLVALMMPSALLSRTAEAKVFYRGADLSASPEMAQAGVRFHDGNWRGDAYQILKKRGLNLVRLRLWHTPDKHSGLAEVTAFARRIKRDKTAFLLDFHFADTWADPGHQPMPAAWKNLSFEALEAEIGRYTKSVLQTLRKAGATPDMVQIGNETNGGFVWDAGKTVDEAGWQRFGRLLKSALRAVHEVDAGIQTMLHVAGPKVAPWFFDNIARQNIDFDLIGLSYYPGLHGADLSKLRPAVESLHARWNKPVLIVETAYPFTDRWADWTNNGGGDIKMAGYAVSPAGQRQFLLDLKAQLKATRGCIGFCYWAPDWVAAKGPQAKDGSMWENLALFDFGFQALPALSVFEP